MKNKITSILVIAIFSISFFACSGSSNDNDNTNENPSENHNENSNAETNNNNNSSNETELNTNEGNVETFEIDGKSLGTDLFSGKYHTGIGWTDNNGINIFVVSYVEKEHKPTSEYEMPTYTREIHGYHYIDNNGDYELVREVKDYENKCEFDNRLRMGDNSLTITDLDEDGYGEVCIVYYLGCTSEYSHDGIKLLFLENGDKYAIRGTTSLSAEYIGEDIAGETNIDGNFKKGPKEFLNYAQQVWDEYQPHGKY